MSTYFRIIATVLLACVFLFSCLKKPDRKEVENNLKKAMGLYLNHQPRIDTSKTKFNVLTVSYFEDSVKGYICEFQVNMKQQLPERLVDTIGYMNALVSKDFKTVVRKR